MGLWALTVGGSLFWLPRFLEVLVFLVGIPVLVVWGIVALIRGSAGPRNSSQPDPEQILKVRLAQGEIDTEEYERLRGFIRSERW
jgi:uncharacterized membrane protein